MDYSIDREVFNINVLDMCLPVEKVKTIITSPPYMKSLTYARDNRLRLWFLGIKDWRLLDKLISPNKNYFSDVMDNCLFKWSNVQDNIPTS
jgi:tRNA G10  N-methylase Trm11